MNCVFQTSVRYGLVGVLNSVVGFAVIAAITKIAPQRPVIANAIGYAFGLILGFVLNKTWTFTDARPWTTRAWPYLILTAFAYAANLVTLLVSSRIKMLGPYVPQLLGMLAYTSLSFFGSYAWVFKARRP
jgi:putative flippase GtrA